MNITFIFDRCRRSLAAETSVKHECDSKILTGVFMISKFNLREKLTDIALVTLTACQKLQLILSTLLESIHDDVIKWKHFPRYRPFVRGIHRSPVNSPHKGQWRGALMFSLICVSINGWVNNREAGDLRRYRAHYDVIVMWTTDM